jgi:hypothetical protein
MSLIGSVDTLAETCISGWAADDAGRDEPVQVDVIVNSLLVATVPCEIFREDLLLAGIGDGRKGFRFDASAHLKPGRNDLEVRYAGAKGGLPRGLGHWVKRREGRISEWEAAFLAALEAYYEFRPEHHVCGIGEGAGELEHVFFEAGIPFRKFTRLEVPRDPAVIRLGEKADLVVSWAWPKPAPECVQVLQQVVHHHMNKPGFLAIGFTETPEVFGQIRQAFEECGAPEVKLESIARAPGGMRRVFAFAEAGGAERRLTEATPVLAHVHVPKCAGTSLRLLQERYFGARHLGLYVDDTYFVYAEEVLRGYLLQNPEIQGFSSHHVRVFPHWLAGREMLYVTFLRDPIQQFVSYMTHVKKLYAGITSKSLLEAVPPDAPQLTLREFARWLLTQDRDIPFRENHNVNFFARHSAPAALDRLEAAKAALSEFFFVGITERMDESMAKLRALARAAGLDFPPGPMPVENTSADYRDDLSWIHPGDEVGSLLLRSVEKDRELYDWAARVSE